MILEETLAVNGRPLSLAACCNKAELQQASRLEGAGFPSNYCQMRPHQTPGALLPSHLLKRKSYLRNEKGASTSPNLVNAAIVTGTQAR